MRERGVHIALIRTSLPSPSGSPWQILPPELTTPTSQPEMKQSGQKGRRVEGGLIINGIWDIRAIDREAAPLLRLKRAWTYNNNPRAHGDPCDSASRTWGQSPLTSYQVQSLFPE